MNVLLQATLLTLFPDKVASQVIPTVEQLYRSMVEMLICHSSATPQLSPNTIEQIKYLCACLRKVGQKQDLSASSIISEGKFNAAVDYLIATFKRSEIDPVFRKYILLNLPGILKHTKTRQEKAQTLLTAMIDVDNPDI